MQTPMEVMSDFFFHLRELRFYEMHMHTTRLDCKRNKLVTIVIYEKSDESSFQK